MAYGQMDYQNGDKPEWATWTILFSAFRVALDPKKLLLAAGGVLTMAVGWWVLAMIFYLPASGGPQSYEDYKTAYEGYEDRDVVAWRAFKRNLRSWNLLHELAGPVASGPQDKDAVRYNIADSVAERSHYEDVKKEVETIRAGIKKRREKVAIISHGKDKRYSFKVGGFDIPLDLNKNKIEDVQSKLDGKITAEELVTAYDFVGKTVTLKRLKLKIKDGGDWNKFVEDISKTKTIANLEAEVRKSTDKHLVHVKKAALDFMRSEESNKHKPAGYLATMPWMEDRGSNPIELITGLNPVGEDANTSPWREGRFFDWLVTEQLPILLDPLRKFLTPILYLFHPDATWWIRTYLLLVILWTIATWSLFGGAITRMAVVQVAQPTESIGMREAVKFTVDRYTAYLSGQLIPLGFLAFMAILLVLFGLVEVFTFALGDIVVAGLGLPIVMLIGLIMAVLIIGLLGWPLMHATISAEGSDSFDAISRSYSYVFQAPWSYAWYSAIALLYGAVVIFVVNLGGAMSVYLGKWGMSQVPNAMEREPSYLFMWTPPAHDWRNMLLKGSPHVMEGEVMQPSGEVKPTYVFRPSFEEKLWPVNYIGAGMVAFWIWLIFMLVLGFSYSFFWSAATIIYLMMRRRVDDTEFDEIHLDDDEEIDAPFVPPPAEKREGTVPLPMTEQPPKAQPTDSEPPPESDAEKSEPSEDESSPEETDDKSTDPAPEESDGEEKKPDE